MKCENEFLGVNFQRDGLEKNEGNAAEKKGTRGFDTNAIDTFYP